MSDSTSRLDIERTDGRVVLSGDIDAHTCPQLADVLDPLAGAGDVYVDMAAVQFMDSSGLRVLIGTHQVADAAGHKLVIEQPSKSVSRIIEISGLSEHLHVSDLA